jgi:hypothetical protein
MTAADANDKLLMNAMDFHKELSLDCSVSEEKKGLLKVLFMTSSSQQPPSPTIPFLWSSSANESQLSSPEALQDAFLKKLSRACSTQKATLVHALPSKPVTSPTLVVLDWTRASLDSSSATQDFVQKLLKESPSADIYWIPLAPSFSETLDIQLVLQKRQQQQLPTSNSTWKYFNVPYSKRPLFQKYVFFNEALFMALLPMAIILLISYFGVRLLSGIQSPTQFDSNPSSSSSSRRQ